MFDPRTLCTRLPTRTTGRPSAQLQVELAIEFVQILALLQLEYLARRVVDVLDLAVRPDQEVVADGDEQPRVAEGRMQADVHAGSERHILVVADHGALDHVIALAVAMQAWLLVH